MMVKVYPSTFVLKLLDLLHLANHTRFDISYALDRSVKYTHNPNVFTLECFIKNF